MNGRYYSANEFFRDSFGEKVYKLSLDLGLTCPNRDGTLDRRGCAFCLGGSSAFSAKDGTIEEKLKAARALVSDKTDAKKFIAYFQSYTNTYAPVSFLESAFLPLTRRDDICALSIATRPDCLGRDVLELLARIAERKPLMIELGLQTSNEKTACDFRRGYDNDVYREAVNNLHEIGAHVITHLILGLKNETVKDMTDSVNFAVAAGTDGLKLQLLHVLRGTDYARDYASGELTVLSMEEYLELLCTLLPLIPEHVVLHRLTGDAPKRDLIAPLWSGNKKRVLNELYRLLEARDVRQGSRAAE